jgi:hypothetical protein
MSTLTARKNWSVSGDQVIAEPMQYVEDEKDVGNVSPPG